MITLVKNKRKRRSVPGPASAIIAFFGCCWPSSVFVTVIGLCGPWLAVVGLTPVFQVVVVAGWWCTVVVRSL